ncbi:helix-turn-helix domain-containing protein [Phenylobacterium sp.]|jgi:transcriptional regulator with XRE-family HTH domain|uniref:helix-turn-helix domain-containing protein n=1 Tax=Phenylobacterium sp. TaxID=1871053 RepID=UPI0037848AFA
MTKPFKPNLATATPVDADAHPVDRHVGLRIRMRRKELGMSQDKLAEALGITFQQVQKYERGSNRVSASKLWETARALRAPINYFYEGLPEDSDASTKSLGAHAFLMTTDGLELAASFPKIEDPKLRRKLVELVQSLASDEITDD